MITMIRQDLFWPKMNKEVEKYLSHCIGCQKVKEEHQHRTVLLQLLPIPEWKWKIISMDFIIGQPKI